MAIIDINNLSKALDAFYSKIRDEFAERGHGLHLTLGTTSDTAYRGDYGDVAYTHSQAPHAPSNAQRNSDITKAEIEARLTGTITSHSHTIAKITDLRLKNGVSGVTIADPDQTWASADINGNDIIFGGSYNDHTTTDANIVFASGNGKINMVIDGEYYAAEGKQRVYHTGYKPTPADIGAAASSHGTHVSYGGNGSASTVSRSDHTHNYAGSSSAGGTANSVNGFTFWSGTQSQYDAIATKSSTTVYMITD